jgi:hypothetical protein
VPTNQPTNLRQQPDSSRSSQHDVSSKESFQVSVPSISLPKGGGAIRGISKKFAANPVTGTGSMTVPIATSSGRSGLGPNSKGRKSAKVFYPNAGCALDVKANHEILARVKDEKRNDGPLRLPVSDGCLRRIFRWRVPPNWSVSDWRKEMRAEAACAAWEAVRDYDPSLGVPLGAFAHQRVLTRTLTRYRQEWAYALRLAPEYDSESSSGSRLLDSAVSAMFDRCPRQALSGLSKAQLWLAEQLFLKDRTEADIAAQIGITQQAINKRKRAIVIELRRYIDRTILSVWAACLLPVF